jgi:hypothetical protein
MSSHCESREPPSPGGPSRDLNGVYARPRLALEQPVSPKMAGIRPDERGTRSVEHEPGTLTSAGGLSAS